MLSQATNVQAEELLQALLDGSAMPPPPGQISNYVNPPNLNSVVILTIVLSLLSASLAVLMRVYTKLFLIKSFDYEDYAIILGWDMNITSITYSLTVFFIKLSILLQYLRIFVPSRKANMPMFVGIQFCIWTNFTFYLLSTGFTIGLCNPRRKIWQPWLQEGHCYSYADWDLASGIFNVISDTMILLLPMPCLWKLQMPLHRKLVTMAIFATGSLACVTSILRTYYAWKVVKQPDISYNLIKVGLWTGAEIAIGTIVACLPVLPKFFRYIGPRLCQSLSTIFKSNSSSKSSSEGMRKSVSSGSNQRSSINRHERTMSPDRWKGSSIPKAQSNGEYIALEEYSARLYQGKTICDPESIKSKTRTSRWDLEKGNQDIDTLNASGRSENWCAREISLVGDGISNASFPG